MTNAQKFLAGGVALIAIAAAYLVMFDRLFTIAGGGTYLDDAQTVNILQCLASGCSGRDGNEFKVHMLWPTVFFWGGLALLAFGFFNEKIKSSAASANDELL